VHHVWKGKNIGQLQAHHHHSSDPEEQDITTHHKETGRIEYQGFGMAMNDLLVFAL
jgi:hypothetical protein